MGDLAPHFDRAEFICPCCGRTAPDRDLVILATALQGLRDRLYAATGREYQIHIHTAEGGAARCLQMMRRVYRGRPVNWGSQHYLGNRARAVDCHAQTLAGARLPPDRLAQMACLVPLFDRGGIGVYDWGCHLDIRPRGPARWGKPWLP